MTSDTHDPAGRTLVSIERERLLELYERMVTIRRFEEAVADLYKRGDIPGFTHLYAGQEAVAVGVCANLRSDDFITSTHRGHGHVIAKGASLDRMMAELFARTSGYCKGKGGSMHIADFSLGILGANGIVGAGLPIAVGAGYSSRLRGSDQVVASFFGDGAVTEGAFHEAVNMAAAWSLPVLFVLERNDFAVGTRFSRISNIRDVAHLGASYGLRTASVDGNDIQAVHRAAAEAVAIARSGGGASLIACSTFRQRAHFEGDHTRYMGDGELEAWKRRDPLVRCAEELRARHGVAQDELEAVEARVGELIESAVAFARAAPEPELDAALEDVYA